MKRTILVVCLYFLSFAVGQYPYYGWGYPYYYPGLPYSPSYPGYQAQYLSPSQQKHLTSLAHQHTKLLAMSQMRRPQMMYTSIAGVNWSKLPAYKPQYAYTKTLQPFLRPQTATGQLGQQYTSFIKLPASNHATAAQSTIIKNYTKTPVSTNHVFKPSTMLYAQAAPNSNSISKNFHTKPLATSAYIAPSISTKSPMLIQQMYSHKMLPMNQYQYLKHFAKHPNSNSILSQYPKAMQQVQGSVNSILSKVPQSGIYVYKAPKIQANAQAMKNVIMSVETPANLIMTTSQLNKNQANTQSPTPVLPTNTVIQSPVVKKYQKPETYNAYLGQTLMQNGQFYPSQANGLKTILTPVKTEENKGPIYTMQAPHLGLGEKPKTTTASKIVAQQTSTYNQEVPVYKPIIQETLVYKPVVQDIPSYKPVIQDIPSYKPVIQDIPSYKPVVQDIPSYKPVVQDIPGYKPNIQENLASKPIVVEETPSYNQQIIYSHFVPDMSIYKSNKQEFKPVQQSASYSFQGENQKTTYEVTEPPSEKATQSFLYPQYPQRYTSRPKSADAPKTVHTQYDFSPMIVSPHIYQNKQASQMLTSQEFYDILNSVTPEHQLSNIFGMSTEEQPQPSTQLMQQTIAVGQPLQAFDSMPSYESKDMFKPSKKYGHKMREPCPNREYSYQPSYHQSFPSTGKSKMQSMDSMNHEQDSTNNHMSIVRNTKDEATMTSQNEIHSEEEIKNDSDSLKQDKNVILMPEPDTYNTEMPTTSKPVMEMDIQERPVSQYYPPLTEKDVDETLATIQVASNLMKAAKYHGSNLKQNGYKSMGFQSYFAQNPHTSDSQYHFITQENNAFIPIKEKIIENENHVPIRIFVPDLYDDDVDADSNDNKNQVEEENSLVNYDVYDSDTSKLQDYVDYASDKAPHFDKTESGSQKNKTNDEVVNKKKQQQSAKNNNHSQQNVLVYLQKNKTDPSLDIVTKDWKTSIVIKSTEDESVKNLDEEIYDEDFGSRIRPKRQVQIF